MMTRLRRLQSRYLGYLPRCRRCANVQKQTSEDQFIASEEVDNQAVDGHRRRQAEERESFGPDYLDHDWSSAGSTATR
jgi:hypothetical protein